MREEFADVFKLPKSQVRVITEYMGGGFGAKFGAGNEGVVAASLSRKAKAPVKLMLDRKQEHIVCNRPDSHQQLKIGAKRDGTLTAIKLTSYGTAGVGTGAVACRNQHVQVPQPVDGERRCLVNAVRVRHSVRLVTPRAASPSNRPSMKWR